MEEDLFDDLAQLSVTGQPDEQRQQSSSSSSSLRNSSLESDTTPPERSIEKVEETLELETENAEETLESRILSDAPNLCALVGTLVASKLIGAAGGLPALGRTPASNVWRLGAEQLGNSSLPVGFIQEVDIVNHESTPPRLRMSACSRLAAKSSLAARIDLTGNDPSGNAGKKMREEVIEAIKKWQQRPDDFPVGQSLFQRRGGRRLREMKERYNLADARRLTERLQFGGGVPGLVLGLAAFGTMTLDQVGV